MYVPFAFICVGFFFRVTNTRKDMSVKFNLLNHTKPDSLFNCGMKVLVYSETMNKVEGKGWHREGRDIAYYQNNFKKVSAESSVANGVGYSRQV